MMSDPWLFQQIWKHHLSHHKGNLGTFSIEPTVCNQSACGIALEVESNFHQFTLKNIWKMIIKNRLHKIHVRGLTNLEELSLVRVLALPNASSTEVDWMIWYLTVWNSGGLPVTAARYWRLSLAASVLPEPDSPEITRHWSQVISRKVRHARSVTAYLSNSERETKTF